ncbi:hypothetical protein DERP_005289 [Dermatophagoides pteronyssinus]|uniref:Uncharacterized protein n=1 Tax=Dermatophagoides pteronyssinus TaxID=6956 RepID=A0ABQ8JMS1_DERPT|nr:hypothetical protein DERP_005289 [Dermatophagoides pteronyssinus]
MYFLRSAISISIVTSLSKFVHVDVLSAPPPFIYSQNSQNSSPFFSLLLFILSPVFTNSFVNKSKSLQFCMSRLNLLSNLGLTFNVVSGDGVRG